MSWGGPAAGTAHYQSPSFASQQQAYPYPQPPNQSQFPNGPPQRPPDNRPPKKKGNPIITRYPPPPGYRGPAQPQGPYGTTHYSGQYAPPQQSYQQGYSAPPSYQHPNPSYPAPHNMPPTPQYSPGSYGPPQNFPTQQGYPQQNYQPPPNQQYVQPPYASSQGYGQPPGYPASQGFNAQQSAHPGYPPQITPTEPIPQSYPAHSGWQAPTAQPVYPPSAYGGSQQDPNALPTPTSAFPASAQSTPTTLKPEGEANEPGGKPQLYLAWDDWDFDFDGAIWPKSNEPVDPNLSLGVIIWRPAKQVTRALPSTFEAAEEQALKPPAEKLGNGESVSIYFTLENSHEAFLDVRQTDEWHKIKRDPIFVVFTDKKDMELVPLKDCAAWRDRPDELPSENEADPDEEMHDTTWNVMDNLEQALSGQDQEEKSSIPAAEHVSHKNQKQEDILAMLGVTGSPKPPSDEPMSFPFPPLEEKPSASLPPKPPLPPSSHPATRPELSSQRANSYGGHHNTSYGTPAQRLNGPLSAMMQKPPPPPPPKEEYDPWNPRNSQTLTRDNPLDGLRGSPSRSEASNHTLIGSDFVTETPVTNTGDVQASEGAALMRPAPQLERSDSSFSRKRSYGDTDQSDEKSREQDDHIKRKRRSETANVYSRR